jgi:hypothetical protein
MKPKKASGETETRHPVSSRYPVHPMPTVAAGILSGNYALAFFPLQSSLAESIFIEILQEREGNSYSTGGSPL